MCGAHVKSVENHFCRLIWIFYRLISTYIQTVLCIASNRLIVAFNFSHCIFPFIRNTIFLFGLKHIACLCWVGVFFSTAIRSVSKSSKWKLQCKTSKLLKWIRYIMELLPVNFFFQFSVENTADYKNVVFEQDIFAGSWTSWNRLCHYCTHLQ